MSKNSKKKLENLPQKDRIALVKCIFSQITSHYDQLNHILSGWRDIYWRKFTVKRLPPNCRDLIDVATGTGDLAILSYRKFRDISIKGIDFSGAMLKLADRKTREKRCRGITYIMADAVKLPFPDNSFDAAMAAFAFRNIPDRLGALIEMKRVVRSGGKILVLEMTRPTGRLRGTFFKYYLKLAVPALGGMISGKRDAYKYLSQSIEEFLSPDELKNHFLKAGLKNIEASPLTFGITYLHEGFVP